MISILTLAVLFSMSQPTKTEMPTTKELKKERIQILPVARSAESNTVYLTIAVPKSNQLVNRNPVWVQFRLDGFSLGSGSSQFERSREIVNSKMGQTVHVIIDNDPYIAIDEPALDPFDESGYFYNTSYKFEVPKYLKPGFHTIRMFPARSFGESLKQENSFHAISFYVGEKEKSSDMDLTRPYLTYNEPSDQMPWNTEKPVLLDFIVKNCELTADGFKVLLKIDGNFKRNLDAWQPYYIYGLDRGNHTIELELLDPKGKRVPGLFNYVKRSFKVE